MTTDTFVEKYNSSKTIHVMVPFPTYRYVMIKTFYFFQTVVSLFMTLQKSSLNHLFYLKQMPKIILFFEEDSFWTYNAQNLEGSLEIALSLCFNVLNKYITSKPWFFNFEK